MMKQIGVGILALAVAGCVPGEATIKLSAEDVRRVLRGEVVEVSVHADVKAECPIGELGDPLVECPMCNTKSFDVTNYVPYVDSCYCAAANAMTILLADGSCVTGGLKIVGTNAVHWANVNTKFLFGTEAALSAASNKVAECNGCVVLDSSGVIRIARVGGDYDSFLTGKRRWSPDALRIERIFRAFRALEEGCKCCKSAYGSVVEVLNISQYDAISLVFEGDGKDGFCIETGDERVAAGQIGKELRCDLRHKDSNGWGKAAKPIKLRKH